MFSISITCIICRGALTALVIKIPGGIFSYPKFDKQPGEKLD